VNGLFHCNAQRSVRTRDGRANWRRGDTRI
jgi:hypothetical protein